MIALHANCQETLQQVDVRRCVGRKAEGAKSPSAGALVSADGEWQQQLVGQKFPDGSRRTKIASSLSQRRFRDLLGADTTLAERRDELHCPFKLHLQFNDVARTWRGGHRFDVARDSAIARPLQ